MKKKNVFAALTLTIALAVTSVSAYAASQNADDRQSSLILPVEVVNQVMEQKGLEKVTASDIPTVAEVNAAFKGVIVEKGQTKAIPLGHGHSIVISAGSYTAEKKVATSTIQPESVQNQTATGTISYVVYGTQMFSLTETINYTYDNMTAEILFHDDEPTVAAPGWIGWSTTINSKYVRNTDPANKVKDAVCNVTWSTTAGTKYGYMELRFTGAGNYYVTDTSYIR